MIRCSSVSTPAQREHRDVIGLGGARRMALHESLQAAEQRVS